MTTRRRPRPGRKPGAYSQAERVLRLHAALVDGRIVRVSEVAEELEVSVRQVQRDLAVVRGHLGDRLAQREDGAWVVRRELTSAADRRSARSAILGVAIGAKLSSALWGEATSRRLRARVDGLITGLGATDASRFDGWQRRVAVVAPGQKDYAGRPELAQRLDQMLEAMIRCGVVRLAYRSHQRAMRGAEVEHLVARVGDAQLHAKAVALQTQRAAPAPRGVHEGAAREDREGHAREHAQRGAQARALKERDEERVAGDQRPGDGETDPRGIALEAERDPRVLGGRHRGAT